jgi:hypothetical protein
MVQKAEKEENSGVGPRVGNTPVIRAGKKSSPGP